MKQSPSHKHNNESKKNSLSKLLNDKVKASVETILVISGVDCSEEVAAIESSLKATNHVREVKVSILSGKSTIQHDGQLSESKLIQILKTSGLSAQVEGSLNKLNEGEKKLKLSSVIVSGGFTGTGLLTAWLINPSPDLLIQIIYGIAIISGAWFIAPKAFRTIKQKRFDMNVLMTVAVIGAIIIGEWAEAAAVTFLFALSELLEGYSVSRARRAIESLMELSPLTALVKRKTEVIEVELSEISTDETIIIKSGAKVPLDGIVSAGFSSINQSPITGESLPVEKKVGDQVFAGTINGEGSLEVTVTGKAGETTLASMIRLIEDAQSQKAPSERFVDTFAKYYTPIIMILAVLVFLIPGTMTGDWSIWFYRALVLLVIACPCALVISTPVSVVSGLTAMARRGVLIKGGAYLETVGKLRAIAVDKTGTITKGLPEVSEVITFTQQSSQEIIKIVNESDNNRC